ncbi:hypothetical protein GO755_28015 [Spirosoma sp. HMF4905]|uniref:T9SS C-terminal target domain-containing protein n=1 Tax=Spirosoma arboris TaxID=2682092 RepID=A0A7K1SJG4_9BACT|nr:hypothetical protein [Spirosoma arboris]MVM33915.1 hypothetical protein [Spirosoma arboris]
MKKYTLMAVMTASILVWNCKPDELTDEVVKPTSSGARVAIQPAPIKLWDATFGGDTKVIPTANGGQYVAGTDDLTAAIALADGGVVLGGSSDSPTSGNKTTLNLGGYDFWLVNMDPNGARRAMQTVGGSGVDKLTSMLQTSDGGYLLGGYSNSPKDPLFAVIGTGTKSSDSRGYDFWVVKLGKPGNRQWDITAGGTGDERLTAMVPTADGGYLLGGSTNSSADTRFMKYGIENGTKGGTDYWIMKIDANGKKQWDKSYGTADKEELKAIVRTADGGFLLAGNKSGYVYEPGKTTLVSTSWLVKIDGNGNKVWEKTLQTLIGDNTLEDAIATSDGGFLLGASTNAGAGGDKSQAAKGRVTMDYWVIKLDSQGNKVWDKTIGTSSTDLITSLAATTDGGYLIGGSSGGSINGDKTETSRGYGDYWVVKVNAQGEILWDKTIGGADDDYLYKLIITADGGILAAGSSNSSISGEKTQRNFGAEGDYWAVKLK